MDVRKAGITLQGEGRDKVTVTATSAERDVFHVWEVDYINISDFTITGGCAGIFLDLADHCNIFNNDVTSNGAGIVLNPGCYNAVSDNTFNSNTNNGIIFMDSANICNNSISCNYIYNNGETWIYIDSSGIGTGNTLEKNHIRSNGVLQDDSSWHYNFYNEY